MWIRKIGLGILIGVVLCSVMVNAEERNSRKAEPMTVMERMREIPHKIYGKKKSRNKMRKVPGKFKLPPDARIGDIIKTKSGYKQIIDIFELLDDPKANGQIVKAFLQAIDPEVSVETYALEGPQGINIYIS